MWPGEGHSRGLLRDCESFGNPWITYISSSKEHSVSKVRPGGPVSSSWLTACQLPATGCKGAPEIDTWIINCFGVQCSFPFINLPLVQKCHSETLFHCTDLTEPVPRYIYLMFHLSPRTNRSFSAVDFFCDNDFVVICFKTWLFPPVKMLPLWELLGCWRPFRSRY